MAVVNIVNLERTSLLDIPGMLRNIADQAEAGEFGPLCRSIIILETQGGELEVFGPGEFADTARVIGLLEMAKIQMAMGEDG